MNHRHAPGLTWQHATSHPSARRRTIPYGPRCTEYLRYPSARRRAIPLPVGACPQANPSHPQKQPPRQTQRGAGLIEVMVALLVLAIGLLGFAAMQTQGISQGQKAYLHSQAIFAAQDMVERMRANPIAITSYALSFADSAPTGTDCSSANCTPAALAGWDQAQWLSLLNASLPMGDGQIQVVSTGTPTVVVISVRYRLNRDLDVTDQTRNKNITAEQVYELRTQI